MAPLSWLRDALSRAAERKWLLAAGGALFLIAAAIGGVLCHTSGGGIFYRLCGDYLAEVCAEESGGAALFFARAGEHLLLLALVLAGGVHPAALCLPALLLAFRAWTFGGCIVVFFSAYRMTGALAVLTLYLPVHLLFDLLLLLAAALSCGRARGFRFCRADGALLLRDFLVFAVLTVAVCLIELLLRAALFRPLGAVV